MKKRVKARDSAPPLSGCVAVALVGGNCNNGANCGPWAVNLNNTAGNANWNIGASPS